MVAAEREYVWIITWLLRYIIVYLLHYDRLPDATRADAIINQHNTLQPVVQA